MANCTDDGNATNTLTQTSILPAGIGVFLFGINIFLSFTALLGNALVLIGLHKVSSFHPPSKLLFKCLTVTDLGVGLISQPLFAIFILSYVTELNRNISFFALKANRTSSFIFCQVSISTSTAISVDRLLALFLGLRYRHFVTSRRVCAVISCFWLIAVSDVIMQLLFSFLIALTAFVILALLSVVISFFSYTKIFLTLRQQQAQVQAHVQGQPNGIGEMPLNVARYKKTVSSIAWVQLTLVACYVPFSICVIKATNGWDGTVKRIVWNTTVTLVYLNSSLNPLLYCWKIKELRQKVKCTIKKFCCCLN